MTCPRFAGVCEHAGERLIIPGEDPAALMRELIEHALEDPPHRPEAIVDLDTNTRHEAINNLVITFKPKLPGAPERLMRFIGGERSALRLLCEIAEEHASENEEAREAVAMVEDFLGRASTVNRGESQ